MFNTLRDHTELDPSLKGVKNRSKASQGAIEYITHVVKKIKNLPTNLCVYKFLLNRTQIHGLYFNSVACLGTNQFGLSSVGGPVDSFPNGLVISIVFSLCN